MSIWRRSTTNILVIGIILIVIATAVAFVLMNFQPKTEVKLADGVFQVKVADNEAAREQGLSGVDRLQPNEGLLMVFESDDDWGIWMKDMKIPIDIIWLDKNKSVVYIIKNASPDLGMSKVFTPSKDARYVLELPAGNVQQAGIKVGDSAYFTLKEVEQ